MQNFIIDLGGWQVLLTDEELSVASALYDRAYKERVDDCKCIYPAQENIFRALQMTPPEKVKAVIIGQDPYIREGQADGLAFSCTGPAMPPSLKNIIKELVADIGCQWPVYGGGDLSPWAERGVLLLNTTLTVYFGQSNSHEKWGWKKFTHGVIRASLTLPQPIVYIQWGGNARAFVADLQISSRWKQKKTCIWSSHPSPLGATKSSPGVPAFIGSKPFSEANKLLVQMGGEPIDWELP